MNSAAVRKVNKRFVELMNFATIRHFTERIKILSVLKLKKKIK